VVAVVLVATVVTAATVLQGLHTQMLPPEPVVVEVEGRVKTV
jgi:hypothetical protein